MDYYVARPEDLLHRYPIADIGADLGRAVTRTANAYYIGSQLRELTHYVCPDEPAAAGHDYPLGFVILHRQAKWFSNYARLPAYQTVSSAASG